MTFRFRLLNDRIEYSGTGQILFFHFLTEKLSAGSIELTTLLLPSVLINCVNQVQLFCKIWLQLRGKNLIY